MASELFEQLRESETAVAVWAVKVVIPTFENIVGDSFFWATSKIDSLSDGNSYEAKLVNCRGRHQRDRGNDYAEFTVSNPQNSTYQKLYKYEDLIEKAEVTIYECYEISDDVYEAEQKFFGYLKDFSLDDKSKTISFTSDSDMSRKGYPVGGIILTRERCRHEFNYFGLKSPDTDPCGWQTTQGGNPFNCSHYRKGVDGCDSHNNEQRIGLVEGVANAVVEIVADDIPASGFDYSSDACFTENTFVVMANWNLKPINKIKKGEQVLGFDLFNNDRLIPTDVLARQVHQVEELTIAKFENAIFETTREHLFYLGKKLFLPVGAFRAGETVQCLDKDKNKARDTYINRRSSIEKAYVYNLQTSTGTYIIADRHTRLFYCVHNSKASYPQNLLNYSSKESYFKDLQLMSPIV